MGNLEQIRFECLQMAMKLSANKNLGEVLKIAKELESYILEGSK